MKSNHSGVAFTLDQIIKIVRDYFVILLPTSLHEDWFMFPLVTQTGEQEGSHKLHKSYYRHYILSQESKRIEKASKGIALVTAPSEVL